MLDNRIYTFLKLCETMNYRKTAEQLNMTQPAVTQHIHYLEGFYGVKLFDYTNKVLTKTESGIKLEEYSRSVVYNEKSFQKEIAKPLRQKISIGATKTIGDYEIDNLAFYCIENIAFQFNLIIDNTEHLLQQLDNFMLDFLIVEGYFDKNKYDFMLYKNTELVGICAKNHPFADKTVDINNIFSENIVLRETGSGTRKVFENFLAEHNYSYDNFASNSVISSFKLIEKVVEKGLGISFVYQSIAEKTRIFQHLNLKEAQYITSLILYS